MCGINGILYLNRFNSDKPETYFEDYILKMNSALSHRGPDGEGVLIDYPLCFGHMRLSIIDLSKEANQPMFNEDKTIAIIYNGEIYNYRELIPELKDKGHIFKTKSDTEVIIHAYEEYGEDCVNRFNGMWAFAIYDFKNKFLFASRDRFGVKPFYYFLDSHQFIFSSEIKSILKIKNLHESNHGKVHDYLAYGYKTSDGQTFFKDIKELLPAHNIRIENDKFINYRYWNFSGNQFSGSNPVEELKHLITDAVKIRYRSDVPVSILLSGGIDSGIITKITDELISREEIRNMNVTAYSAVFPGFDSDESKNISDLLNTCLHIDSVKITPSEINLVENFNNFVYGMGEPVFNSTSFAHYMLMKEIRKQNVKVVLNGQGADEAFCGYGKYITGYYLLDVLMKNPISFLSEIRLNSSNLNLSYKYIIQQIIKSMLPRNYASYLRSSYSEKLYRCLSKEFTKSNYGYFQNPGYKIKSGNNLDNYLKYNILYQGFNQILHYEDHSAMQNSVEIRSPFIDYRIMEFAFSIPPKLKFDKGISKKIIRDAFRDKLPETIIDSKKKIGFVTPLEEWMDKPEFSEYISGVLSTSSFRNKRIWSADKIIKAFSEKKYRKGFPLWRIINLELWSQLYNINNL